MSWFRLALLLSFPGFLAAQAPPPAPPASPAPEAAKPVVLASTDAEAIKAAVGKQATVRGKVTRANAWEGGITFLNMEGKFTVVCFRRNLANFPQPPDRMYGGKTIEVSGLVKEHKGKLEIEITRPDQVKVVEDGAAAPPAPAAAPAAKP